MGLGVLGVWGVRVISWLFWCGRFHGSGFRDVGSRASGHIQAFIGTILGNDRLPTGKNNAIQCSIGLKDTHDAHIKIQINGRDEGTSARKISKTLKVLNPEQVSPCKP